MSLVERISEPLPPAPTGAAAILSIIERAARDPGVDVDKMERMFAMHERMMAQEAKAAYAAALAEMQPKLPAIDERGQINVGNEVRSTYAKWADINEIIRPILAEHGFSLSFRTGHKDAKIVITGVLAHNQGHSEETTLELPIDTSGSKNAVQAIGSSTSYGQRYTAKALLNITSRAPEDRDDDGRAAVGNAAISAEQLASLQQLIVDTGSDIPRFLKYIGAERMEDIPVKKFAGAKAMLEKKKAQS